VHFDEAGKFTAFDHTETLTSSTETYNHTSCPVITGNYTGEEGGAIYITGSTETHLNIYCLHESGNTVGDNDPLDGDNDGDQLSQFLMIDGGKVVISTAVENDLDEGVLNKENDHKQGTIDVSGTVHVSGGQVDLYGSMTNPSFGTTVSVDVTKLGDYFRDHRYNDGFYKLLYFENFIEPGETKPSGRYTAVQVPMGEKSEILPVMYVHPGYEIIGWNTNAKGTESNKDHSETGSDEGWYMPTDDILFDGNPVGDLTLYAIWEANVYWIDYDPNTSRYGGDMERQQMKFDVEEVLTENAFTRDGYIFTGWNTEKDGTGDYYKDEATVKNLCRNRDEELTLYAQWEVCDHDPIGEDDKPACEFTYTLNRRENTLIRTCQCNGLEMQVSLTAPKNPVYQWKDDDAVEHPAIKTGPTVTKGEPHEDDHWDPTVYYAKNVGEEQWVLMLDAGKKPVVPSEAGTYAAVVLDDDVTINTSSVAAYVTYTIAKADQPAPEVEGVLIVGEGSNQIIQIKGTVSQSPVFAFGGSDIKTQYQVFYYTAEGVTAGETNDDGNFDPPVGLTNYYVEVWYSEGVNYNASDRNKTYPVFYVGETEVTFIADEGIGYTPHTEADNNKFAIDVFALDGFYLTNDFKIYTEYAGITIEPVTPEMIRQKYSISNIPDIAGLEIIIYLTGVAPKAGITATVAEKREYGDVEDTTITVSRDSAFTAAYEITGYDPSTYADLTLTVNSKLPAGTTILMMDKSGDKITYWDYKATGNETAVPLESFVRMGAKNAEENLFKEPVVVMENGASKRYDLSYQFIVDYSWAKSGYPEGSVNLTLVASKQSTADAQAPAFDSLYEGIIPTVKTVTPETFGMENVETSKELMQKLKFEYTESAGAASRWDGRSPALVLTFVPKTTNQMLPEDVQMKYTIRSADETNGKYITYFGSLSNSSSGQYFITPLVGMELDEVVPGFIDLTLMSDLFPVEAESYQFKAEWIYSRSESADSPLAGDVVASADISFDKAKTFVPALTVSTENNQRLYETGSELVLKVDSSIDAEFEQATTFKVDLLFKTADGDYARTAWEQYVSGDATVKVPLSTNLGTGSFCVRTSVIYANKTVLEVPYYFVIQKTEDGITPEANSDTSNEQDDGTQ